MQVNFTLRISCILFGFGFPVLYYNKREYYYPKVIKLSGTRCNTIKPIRGKIYSSREHTAMVFPAPHFPFNNEIIKSQIFGTLKFA